MPPASSRQHSASADKAPSWLPECDAAIAIGILTEDGFLGGKKRLHRDLAIKAFEAIDTKLPLAHQPGTEFEYGFSTDVLGAVVEQVSGQRMGDYLADNLWKPIGMLDATYLQNKFL